MSNQLRELRQAKSLAQQALAIAARVSPAMIVAIERYQYCPSRPVRERLAEALGCTSADIWVGAECDDRYCTLHR